MPEHNCKNCGASVDGQFCGSCGQKLAHRLDIHHILHEFIHLVFHADKGIFGFVPKFLTQPGIIALEYVEGKRKKYFNPFQYLFIVVGLVMFVIAKANFFEENVRILNQGHLSQRVMMVQQVVIDFLKHYFNFILFLLIPVFAFFSFLFFRSKKYNYAENIVLQCCIQAQQNTISLVTILVIYLMKDSGFVKLMIIVPLAINFFTSAIAYRQFYKVSLLTAFLKTIVISLCVNVIQVIITAIAIFIIVSTHHAAH